MDVGKINTFLRKMILLKPLLLKYWFDLNSVLFSATRVCLQFRNRNFWRISEILKKTKKKSSQIAIGIWFHKVKIADLVQAKPKMSGSASAALNYVVTAHPPTAITACATGKIFFSILFFKFLVFLTYEFLNSFQVISLRQLI